MIQDVAQRSIEGKVIDAIWGGRRFADTAYFDVKLGCLLVLCTWKWVAVNSKGFHSTHSTAVILPIGMILSSIFKTTFRRVLNCSAADDLSSKLMWTPQLCWVSISKLLASSNKCNSIGTPLFICPILPRAFWMDASRSDPWLIYGACPRRYVVAKICTFQKCLRFANNKCLLLLDFAAIFRILSELIASVLVKGVIWRKGFWNAPWILTQVVRA